MLTDIKVEALDKGRSDLPTARRKHLFDSCKGPKHHAVTHAHQAPAAHSLDHLGVEQAGQWPPARFGGRPYGLPTRELDPMAGVVKLSV